MTPQLYYYDLSERVTAFSTTRHGGVSLGNYASLNVNAYCGDTVEHITENRRLLCRSLHLSDTSRLVIPHQVHGDEVCRITEDFLKQPETVRQTLLEGVDAVMTDVRYVCIGVSTADCIPILIYDPKHHCACAVHAGWRGTVARIAEKAVVAMMETYGSRPSEMKAVIGPGISLEAFEVGQEVYDAFCQARFPMELISERLQKWHVNLPLCNRLQLESMGLAPQNIAQSDICTYANVDDFFSARRLGIQSGRIFTGIVLC